LLKIGLIGCGYWGENYIRVLSMIDGIELAWVYSRPITKPSCELPVTARFTNNYEMILNDIRTQAVVISTPPKTHFQIAKDSLQAGKDVLVEKPTTTSSNEVLELINLADNKQRIFMVGHIFLYNPAIVELRRWIERGNFGRLNYIYCRRTGNGPVRSDVSVMWNLAPHDISIVDYLTGGKPPRAVSAHGACYLKQGIEDVVDLVLEYDDNVKAYMHLSWLEPNKMRETTVVGQAGRAVVDDTAEYKLRIYEASNMDDVQTPMLDGRSPLEEQCLHFFKCVKTRRQPLTQGIAGYKVVRIMECAQRSLEDGKQVAISM